MKSIKFDISTVTIEINSEVTLKLNSFKQSNNEDKEKGGVLMGELYPSLNKAVVTNVLYLELNNSSRFDLHLDVKGLQEEMNEIWEKSEGKITYLGDWHTHPENKPKPSFTDYSTFIKNFYLSEFDQNFMIYVIVGKKALWCKVFNGYFFRKKN